MISYHIGPKRSGMESGCVHTGMEKIKWSAPEQVQKLGSMEKRIRNWNDMISYHSVLVWTEKQVQFKSTCRTCLVSMGDIKLVSLTRSNIQVEIRPNCNCTLLICWLFCLFNVGDKSLTWNITFCKFLKLLLNL